MKYECPKKIKSNIWGYKGIWMCWKMPHLLKKTLHPWLIHCTSQTKDIEGCEKQQRYYLITLKAKPNLVDIRASECGKKLKIWWLLLSRSESFLSGLSFQHTVFSFAQSWKCAMEHLCVYLVGWCWWWCRWCWWCWATHGGRSPPLAAALVGWLRRQGANRQQPKSIPTCCRTSTEAGGRPVPGRGGLLDQ